MNNLLERSNCILFFSLPFKPIRRFNPFFNGHIAIALYGTVYQIYNPQLLKSEFLFSIMPVRSWLFGKGGRWVDRDPASPNFRHVYLYTRCESRRTAVYGAGVTLKRSVVDYIRYRFIEEDKQFKEGRFRYSFFNQNCSSIIADVLAEAGLVTRNPLNKIPVCFFKNFVRNQKSQSEMIIRSIAHYDRRNFTLHRICIGLLSFNPQRSMDRWATSISS